MLERNKDLAVSNAIEFIKRAINEYEAKKEINSNDVTKEDAFSLGAQIMFIGQQITSISDFKLEPASIEGKVVLHEITKLFEMPTIGQHITEPN